MLKPETERGGDQADLPRNPQLRERWQKCQGMVCGEKPARYHVRHTLQCVTMAETHMGQMPYTEFMTLPGGVTDMRKGFVGLSSLAEVVLRQDPYSGDRTRTYAARRHLLAPAPARHARCDPGHDHEHPGDLRAHRHQTRSSQAWGRENSRHVGDEAVKGFTDERRAASGDCSHSGSFSCSSSA